MLKRLIFALLAMFLVSVVIKLFIHRPEPPVISNPAYLEMVEEAFELKKVFIDNDSLFSIFEKCKGKREREALMFLYAYMPIGDIADYNPALFLEAVRHSFKMRREMPWGKSIPEDIFRHFVLPLRANNEALDSSRVLFYKELKGRVKNLSLYDAVIEVNRWCQEKVVYTPSDERTSSPLATVRTAYGRCGEESVFTVAAMRSVGIPARQVYTPRWAHTDDNHAWVEVWVKGEWHYLGACEPEPKLNVAWFSATAQRGLLMHCRVFGYYSGDEDIIKRTDVFTEINVTANYAPVAKVKVRVTDSDGNPVEGAGVDYKIYNYAELYSAISSVTGADGISEATLGKGDIVVWAYKDGKFGFKKVTPGGPGAGREVGQNGGQGAGTNAGREVGQNGGANGGRDSGPEEVVQIVLDRREGEVFAADLDIVPPAEGKASVDISQEEREENNRRIARGDSLRRAYIATFADSSYVAALVKRLEDSGKIVAESGQSVADSGQSVAKSDSDSDKSANSLDKEKIARFVYASRGNYREIADFLEWLPAESFQTALNMLEVITDKDLRDTPSKVLRSHITNLPKQISEPEGEIFNKYVLNPRVGKEQLGCWRKFLSKEFTQFMNEENFTNNPQAIIDFCRKIKPASKYNPQNIPVTPVGVYKLMAAERASAQGLFIAICRTFGIPARFEEVTGKLQYYLESAWVEANIFDEGGEIIGNVGQIAGDKNTSATGSVTNYGRLMVNYRGKVVDDPKFESHFTIARIENGGIKTLNFRGKEGFEGTNTLRGTFKEPVKLEVGYYSLTCGTRMASGKVLSRVSFFNVEAGKTTNLELIMRDDPQDLRVIGNLNPEARFFNNTAFKEQSIVECTGRGFFVLVFLRSNHEPSTHAIRDILKNSDAFGRLATSAILLFKENKQLEDMAAVRDISDNLPKSFAMGVDPGGKILSEVSASLKLGDNPDLPLVVIADTFGRIVWYTMGYNIGTGGQTLNAFARTQGKVPHILTD